MKFMERVIRYLLSKNYAIEQRIKAEMIEDYLDKKVITVKINEFERPEIGGERILFDEVVLYKSIISHSNIKTEKALFLGNSNILHGNFIDLQEEAIHENR